MNGGATHHSVTDHLNLQDSHSQVDDAVFFHDFLVTSHAQTVIASKLHYLRATFQGCEAMGNNEDC